MAEIKPTAELLAELDKAPTDVLLRERAARAQLVDGDVEASFKTLTSKLINVTAHAKGSPLPSLHRKAIKPTQARVEADGDVFVREFVCAAGRVLFFWIPESLAPRAEQIRESVRARLDAKMATYDAKRGNRSDDDEE